MKRELRGETPAVAERRWPRVRGPPAGGTPAGCFRGLVGGSPGRQLRPSGPGRRGPASREQRSHRPPGGSVCRPWMRQQDSSILDIAEIAPEFQPGPCFPTPGARPAAPPGGSERPSLRHSRLARLSPASSPRSQGNPRPGPAMQLNTRQELPPETRAGWERRRCPVQGGQGPRRPSSGC